MTSLSEATEKITKARQELKVFAETQGREAIGAAFKPLFEKYPTIGSVRWTQYTPHFNDGDVCEFSVHEPQLYDEEGDEIYNYPSGKVDKTFGDGAEETFSDIWDQCNDEDLFKICFGDGVEIRVTRDGLTAEEYDHD